MNDNKLIAEFMQKGSIGFGLYDYDGGHYKLDELKFYTSWDWLMPVVEKCLKTGDNTDKWDDVYNAVSTIDIKEVYKAVVKFIEEEERC